MRVEEVTAEKAIDLSPHNHEFLNPYHGCLMGCPFCLWLNEEGWENRIQVKTNIAGLLEGYLKAGRLSGNLYLGSVCDPFMELERKYQLTKQCLEVIRRYRTPLIITTSASSPVILDCIDLLKSMEQRVIVVVELARIPYIQDMNRGGKHTGITHANALCRAGIETWATLAPVLPGITFVDCVLDQLDARIPVYIDGLHCTADSIQGKRVLEFIKKDYPGLTGIYEKLVKDQETDYLDEIFERHNDSKRLKVFPFQLDNAG